jgi:hypothetical protein
MEKFASFCEVIGSCTESLGQVKFLQIFFKKIVAMFYWTNVDIYGFSTIEICITVG